MKKTNRENGSILSVLAAAVGAVVRVHLSAGTQWNVSAYHVRHQVAHLHGADSLVFKEMCCTVLFADAATKTVRYREHGRSLDQPRPPWRSRRH